MNHQKKSTEFFAKKSSQYQKLISSMKVRTVSYHYVYCPMCTSRRIQCSMLNLHVPSFGKTHENINEPQLPRMRTAPKPRYQPVTHCTGHISALISHVHVCNPLRLVVLCYSICFDMTFRVQHTCSITNDHVLLPQSELQQAGYSDSLSHASMQQTAEVIISVFYTALVCD